MSLELNKIYNEDCIETMKRMPDEFIDLTVTSPPYDDMDEDFNPMPKNGMRDYNGYSWNFKAIARELFRVTKTGGVIVWVVNDPTIDGSESLASSLQKIYFRRVGFNIHDTMIYNTDKPPMNDNRYQQSFEFVIILIKTKLKTFNPIMEKSVKFGTRSTNYFGHRNLEGAFKKRSGGKFVQNQEKIKTNIWKYYVGQGSDDELAFEHPARFPEALARDHIYSWSNEGDLVYDPFMGSGTAAKIAHMMKRNWIGSEISQEYVDLAYKRIDPYLRQTTLF